jgi:hypothetical protein
LKSTQSILSETITLFRFPGDLGEKNPFKAGAFREEAWASGDEPVFIGTSNDNFKPKIVIKEYNETEFDN